jgi:hypothetical protein
VQIPSLLILDERLWNYTRAGKADQFSKAAGCAVKLGDYAVKSLRSTLFPHIPFRNSRQLETLTTPRGTEQGNVRFPKKLPPLFQFHNPLYSAIVHKRVKDAKRAVEVATHIYIRTQTYVIFQLRIKQLRQE